MTGQERQVLDMVVGQMLALADEVRGYRADLNGRLRKLEYDEAAREAREKVEEEHGTTRLRRRDIYVSLIVTNIVAIVGLIAAVTFR